jgi:hypothetical protein
LEPKDQKRQKLTALTFYRFTNYILVYPPLSIIPIEYYTAVYKMLATTRIFGAHCHWLVVGWLDSRMLAGRIAC